MRPHDAAEELARE